LFLQGAGPVPECGAKRPHPRHQVRHLQNVDRLKEEEMNRHIERV
jgi:hypothetical protein